MKIEYRIHQLKKWKKYFGAPLGNNNAKGNGGGMGSLSKESQTAIKDFTTNFDLEKEIGISLKDACKEAGSCAAVTEEFINYTGIGEPLVVDLKESPGVDDAGTRIWNHTAVKLPDGNIADFTIGQFPGQPDKPFFGTEEEWKKRIKAK